MQFLKKPYSVLQNYYEIKDWDQLKSYVLAENILMKSSTDQLTTVLSAIKNRYSKNSTIYPPLKDLAQFESMEIPFSLKKQVLLPYFLNSEPLVEHLLLSYVIPLVHNTYKPEITYETVMEWIRIESDSHKELEKWAFTVLRKWSMAFLTFLRKFDYMVSKTNQQLTIPLLRDETFAYFFLYNFLAGKKPEAISNLNIWKYFALTETDFQKFFYSLNARGWIDSRQAGEIAEIFVNYSNFGEWMETEWDHNRFKLLQEKVKDTLSGERPLIDVPYYIYCYEPSLELVALKEFRNLESRLKHNFDIETISFGDLFWEGMKNAGFMSEKYAEYEVNRESFADDISREVLKEIMNSLLFSQSGMNFTHGVILVKAGSLFPFIHLSNILSAIETKVKSTLIIPYPGTREGYLLNYTFPIAQTYYRGEII